MSFNKNHHHIFCNVSRTFLAVACLMGLLLLSPGCGGAGASLAKNPGGGGGVVFSSPLTPFQVWVGAEPTDRILSCRLEVTSLKLKNSQDLNATADLLGTPSDMELTRVEATFSPVAVPEVPPSSFDQLEMVVTGARVTYLDANGVVQEKDVVSDQTSLLRLNPVVTVGDNPTMLSIAVDVNQTVQVDPVNNLVTLNTPVLSATQTDITSAPGPSPSGIHARPKTQAMSASNSGQVERLVGQVVQVDGDFGQLSLQLGQSGSVLVLSFDGNTMFDNASPDTVNGMLVEVEGRARTDGTLYASAVETLFPDTGVEAEGMLAGTNAPGLLNMVAEDGTGASMTSALVGTTLGVVVDDSTGYGIHLGNEDMGGLPVLFDAGHIAAGQRIEIDSDSALQPGKGNNSMQAQPYMVELLRQTLQGTVQNYQPGESGAAEFDLVLTPSSYLGIMNAGTGTVHVYQRYTTQATIGIQDGMNLSVRGFLFCTDETDNVPPGTTLHFAMVASSITGN